LYTNGAEVGIVGVGIGIIAKVGVTLEVWAVFEVGGIIIYTKHKSQPQRTRVKIIIR